MKYYLTFILGMGLGAILWIASPLIAGTKEAFDSPFYYIVTLIISGIICGVANPVRAWRWGIAIFIGQVMVFVVLVLGNPGPFGLLGVVFIAGYSILSFASTMVVAEIILILTGR